MIPSTGINTGDSIFFFFLGQRWQQRRPAQVGHVSSREANERFGNPWGSLWEAFGNPLEMAARSIAHPAAAEDRKKKKIVLFFARQSRSGSFSDSTVISRRDAENMQYLTMSRSSWSIIVRPTKVQRQHLGLHGSSPTNGKPRLIQQRVWHVSLSFHRT